MARFPNLGLLHQLTGAAIANAYGAGTISAAQQLSRTRRVLLYVRVVTAGGSALTTVNVKLRHRYVDLDGPLTLNWIDLPSHMLDSVGATQPNGQTFRIEHAFTVAAGQTNAFVFELKDAVAIPELAADIKANAAGISGDSVSVYGVAG